MINFSLDSKDKIPFHIHKGKNILRITAIFLLMALIVFSIYSIKHVGYIMITLLFTSVFGLICIRFPRIFLYKNHFVILKKCLIDRFTDRDIFIYDEITKVEFSEGFTDWNYVILLTILGSKDFYSNSKADQLIIKTKDNNTHIFNRSGSKSEFIKTIELINRRINTSTNSKSYRFTNLREG